MITDDDLTNIANGLQSRLSLAYAELLSGDPERIAGAESMIEIYLEAAPFWRSLDYIARVKRWIAQVDPDTKQLEFIEETVARALQDGENSTDWKILSRTARALRYGGRFRLAWRRYQKAVDLIGDLGAMDPEVAGVAADVYADYAEFLVYVGHPEEALTKLGEIPAELVKPWHEWNRAFALHQMAFAARAPFASANPGNEPGEATWYEQSNDILDAIEDSLPPAEKDDMQLLRAANWGALFRIGSEPAARGSAEANLFTFLEGSGNEEWSWTKELRGRFLQRRIYPCEGDAEKVKEWRKAYREHYHENLKVPVDPSLPETRASDGEIDEDDDHGDDGGK